MADTEPVHIEDADWEIWGKLVKSWAMGENRVDPKGPANDYHIPYSLDQMKEQMTKAGMKGFVIPDRVKAVQFIPYNSGVLVIKLAPKQMIKAGEDAVATMDRYPLPAFYDRVYGKGLDPNDHQRLHNERVGDYTIRACA